MSRVDWAGYLTKFVYEGVTVAGVAVVARNTGALLLAQRTMDENDPPDVQETWEFPGGHLEEGEDPLAGALREFEEEIGVPVPPHEVVHGWRAGENDEYQGFVVAVDEQFPLDLGALDPREVQLAVWARPEEAATLNLRPPVAELDLSALAGYAVSGNEESEMTEMAEEGTEEPMLSLADLAMASIPVHGVLAPEETESGDKRGFTAGAVTARPYRLPFMWQKAQTAGHDNSVVVGSVDRLMRKDGLIHWQGSLMPSEEAGAFAEVLAFFGRFGVSVDGDKGSLDIERSHTEGGTWFDAVRAAGLTAVSIPAFAEAYVAFGPHPDMPDTDDEQFKVLTASGDMVSFGDTYDRGPGWVTNPKETKRLHDYWTKKGQPGYAKIGWGTSGDFTRAKKLIGEKIGANSPEDLRYLNQIIAQWHHDALGYWPGELGKPGNAPATPENKKRAARHAASITDGWATVLTSAGWCDIAEELFHEGIEAGRIKEVGLRSDGAILWELDGEFHVAEQRESLVAAATEMGVSGNRALPPLDYFHRPAALDEAESGALTISEPDENGFQHTYGYAAQWGVCHVGMNGRCVEPPRTYSDDYPDFHLGRTKVEGGHVPTGVLTYGVGHRDAKTILSETPEQAYFDNVDHAWAAVRVGEDEVGIWFSGVVLPGVPEDHVIKIEASGQVSGEWLRGAMRACLTVNVPGFPVQQASVEYDEEGNVMALAASAFGQAPDAPCEPTPTERMRALATIDAEVRFEALKAAYLAERGQ